MILIDGLWFFGGNQERGIGRYLDAFFRHECDIPVEQRLWLVPKSAPDRLVNALLAQYGGRSLVFDFTNARPRQQEILRRALVEKDVTGVWLSSPFERPWSLLDFQPLFTELDIPMTAIVFDLLPQQFPEKILNTWPEEDQRHYARRLQKLRQVETLLAISPATKRQLMEQLSVPEKQITVLTFGLSDAWIKVPPEVDLKWWRDVSPGNYVVTISGGEWRKNLAGTLRYFARRYKGKRFNLVVICRLSRQESITYQLLAWRLGIRRQVRWLGFVDERVKWRFLAQAKVFLFLSHGEGLGIPLLEAKKAQVPEMVISQELADAGLDQLVPQATVVKAP